MYRNKKFNRNSRTTSTENQAKKRPLSAIDENATIKCPPRKNARDKNALDDDTASIFDDNNDMLEPRQSSEENIPASQEPSQRYLSQRSNIALTLGRTQSWNSSTRAPNTYFELTLTKAGVQLEDGDTFVLTCNHVAFVSRFRDLLRNSQNYPDNIETFKIGLRTALEPNSRLALKLLSGCTISVNGEDVIYKSQDSMIVNFLMVDFLCDHILDVLLEKIESTATERRSSSNQSLIPLLPLMLSQLRYVVQSKGDEIYERVTKIFENANENGRRDIIASAELVLMTSKHDKFAEMLLENVEDSNDFFNKTTITALTNLSLSPQLQGRLREKVFAFIESNQCENRLLPLLIKFMLKILNEDKEVYLRELVDTLRKVLLHNINGNCNADADNQYQLDLFGYIERGLIRSKKFYTMWQKTIASLPENMFKSVDFIMLLMLAHVKEDNSLYIENILRRRIKNENFTLDELCVARSKFATVLEKYMQVLMWILHDFLREKNLAVANFARSSYVILFGICETVQKSILKKLLELTLDKASQNMTNTALELLKNLHRSNAKDFQNWGMILLPLLDRLNEMTLSQTRVVMELLCSIAYPVPTLDECPTLQDQIDMLVKKQMINRIPLIKKQGIIGCAQLIDCIARIEKTCNEVDFQNLSINTISDIPEGRGKIAAHLFERVQSAVMYCPDSLALFYDELASILVASANDRSHRGYLDKRFSMWLSETMTLYFQTCFTTQDDAQSISGVPTSGLKCINTLEDTNSECSPDSTLSIAVNISELVLKPAIEASSSIFVLAPTFNLLRVLHLQRSEGSLESINALLGCAIILPTFFDEANCGERIRREYDLNTQKKILDIYFHCANWLREIVSSFITQRDPSTKTKVLQRLNYLINVEGCIRQLLQAGPPDYCPPKCQFISESTTPLPSVNKMVKNKPTTSRGGLKSKIKEPNLPPESDMSILNETEGNTMRLDNTIRLGGIGIKPCSNSKLNFAALYGPNEIYRQMDSNVMLILCEDLNINMPFPVEDIGHKIGLYELRFVLTDIVGKLESITGVEKLHSEENLQYIAKPHYFINDLSTFLKNIWKNMKKISISIDKQLEKVNRVYSNMDLFTENFCYLRVCFDLSLRLIAVYFSWPEFRNNSQKELLKKSLLNLTDLNGEKELSNSTFIELISNVSDKFLKYESTILDLKSAAYLHTLLITLRKLAASNNAGTDILDKQAQDIRGLCKKFLQRKWYNYNGYEEKGVRCNVCLDELVKGFLKNCDFKRQRDILTIVQTETKNLKGKDNTMKSFPNFKKTNFPILYRGLCEILVDMVNNVIITQRSMYIIDKLRLWEKSSELLNILLDILKETDISRNFQIFLKYSHMYLKLVLNYSLPEMEECLRRNSERVLDFLKCLQVSTRYLHSLCCHSKAVKNTAIVSQIPFLRETMETLVYRVKAMLAANKCSSVFHLGNLRNKDIHGDDVISQSVRSDAAEDSEEEIPDDDETVCESILDPNELVSNVHVNVKETDASTSKSSTRSDCY